MNLEEKANEYLTLKYPLLVEREHPKDHFKSGYKQSIADITEFIRVNPKATHQAIIEYMEGVCK